MGKENAERNTLGSAGTCLKPFPGALLVSCAKKPSGREAAINVFRGVRKWEPTSILATARRLTVGCRQPKRKKHSIRWEAIKPVAVLSLISEVPYRTNTPS